MSDEQAQSLANLISELCHEIAMQAVFNNEGDYSTPGNEKETKARLVALLRELP